MRKFFRWLLEQDAQELAYTGKDTASKLLDQGRYADAALLLRRRAEGGDAQSQLQLARLYDKGEGVVQNYAEAVRWLRPAAEKGLTAAQARLGEILLVGVRGAEESVPVASAFAQLLAQSPAAKQDFAEAARWNLAAAESGDAGAQARIGYQYASGLGVARDAAAARRWLAAAAAEQGNEAGQLGLGMLLAEDGQLGGPAAAASWFEKAAAQGSAAAKVCLGLLHMRGQGVVLDEVRGAKLMSEAAESGHPAAMYYLGEMHVGGRGVPRDASAAETWLRRAGARGHLQALTACGRLLASAEGMNDPNSAAVLWRQAADLGDGEAQFLLGEAYLTGRGVPREPAEAARWLGKAADRGVTRATERLSSAFADAQIAHELRDATDYLLRGGEGADASALYQLGKLHLDGAGMRRDPVAALAHFQKAAAQGSGAACLQIGIQHATGEGTKQDYAEAAKWYGRAAGLGSSEGAYNLGFLHLRGLGVPKDPVRGRTLLEQAASGGSMTAQILLGDLLATGSDIPRDMTAAAHWYERAALQGNLSAAAALTNILQGTAQSLQRVLPIWMKAAEAGNVAAQRIAGDFLLQAKESERSIAQGVRWLSEAAESGNAPAMVVLGTHFARSGQPEAAKRGFDLFRKAAALGNPDALYNLGVCYSTGTGVPVDHKVAREQYGLAAASGHAGAIKALQI